MTRPGLGRSKRTGGSGCGNPGPDSARVYRHRRARGPLLISVAGMGWLLNPDADSAEKFDLAVVMLRFTFPYLLFISLTALAGAILNTYHRFAAAAFAPVLLNVVLISFAAFVAPNFAGPALCWQPVFLWRAWCSCCLCCRCWRAFACCRDRNGGGRIRVCSALSS